MKILTKTSIKEINEKPYKDTDDVVIKNGSTKEEVEKIIENCPDLTLGKVISKTLATVKSTDPWKSFKLANEFIKNDVVDLSSEDITFIKGLLKESEYVTYIIGQSIELLENGNEIKE